MKAIQGLAFVLAIAGVGMIAHYCQAEEHAGSAEGKKLCVGTFDSRALAVAYAASEANSAYIKGLRKDRDAAKTAGNEAKVKKIEAEGKAQQQRLHEQGFSTAKVENILKLVQEKLPAVAKEAGVDVIVSKWDIAYQSPTAEFVDVTDRLVQLFQPSERTLRIIKDLVKRPPLSMEEAKKIKD